MNISSIRTELMTIKRLSKYFGCNRNKMSRMLRVMEGAEQCDGLWRVPVWSMPPIYLLEIGLLQNSDRRCA